MGEVVKILSGAGYKTGEGEGAVLIMIRSAAVGTMTSLCSGYGVFPDGRKCEGCRDCKPKIKQEKK